MSALLYQITVSTVVGIVLSVSLESCFTLLRTRTLPAGGGSRSRSSCGGIVGDVVNE